MWMTFQFSSDDFLMKKALKAALYMPRSNRSWFEEEELFKSNLKFEEKEKNVRSINHVFCFFVELIFENENLNLKMDHKRLSFKHFFTLVTFFCTLPTYFFRAMTWKSGYILLYKWIITQEQEQFECEWITSK